MNDADQPDGEREAKDRDRRGSKSFAEEAAGIVRKASSSQRLGTFRALYSPAGDDHAADLVGHRGGSRDLRQTCC